VEELRDEDGKIRYRSSVNGSELSWNAPRGRDVRGAGWWTDLVRRQAVEVPTLSHVFERVHSESGNGAASGAFNGRLGLDVPRTTAG